MANALGAIGDSFKLYRKGFREICPPFLALFAFSAALILLRLGVSMYSNLACGAVTEANIVACVSAEFGGFALQAAEPLVGVFIFLAALVPLREAIEGRRVSDWAAHVPRISFNAVKVAAARFALEVVAALPLLASVFLVLGPLMALAATGQSEEQLAASVAAFLFGGGAVVLFGLAVTLLLFIAFAVATTFFELEIVYSRKGVFDALAASYRTARGNLADVLVFHGAWFLLSIALGIAVGFVMLAPSLVLGPILPAWASAALDPLVSAAFSALFILPIRYLSTIMLWKRFAPAEPPFGGSAGNKY